MGARGCVEPRPDTSLGGALRATASTPTPSTLPRAAGTLHYYFLGAARAARAACPINVNNSISQLRPAPPGPDPSTRGPHAVQYQRYCRLLEHGEPRWAATAATAATAVELGRGPGPWRYIAAI